jgi:NadR type nicotinamide-nucleotide adenylyltransferase
MQTPPYNHGFVLGKFIPPHVGHLALVRFARAHCRHLTVLVESHPDEPADATTRARWFHEAMGGDRSVSFHVLEGNHPQSPPADQPEAFWHHWSGVIRDYCPDIDVLVSSEDYGQKLAADQQVSWIPFDRLVLPTSGTLVRANPWARWMDLIEPARRALVRRVVVLGPESTGKSVLCKALQGLSPTVVVPEYAAGYLARNPDTALDEATLERFWQGQKAMQASFSSEAKGWMIEDSHPVTTLVWAIMLGFDNLAHRIFDECRSAPAPHMVLLTHPSGTPWVDDVHRGAPTDRRAFFRCFEEVLGNLGWDFEVINGDWEARTVQACALVGLQLDQWKSTPLTGW